MDIGAWEDYMPHSVAVEPFVSIDAYGTYSYGAAQTYRARIQGRNRVVTNSAGDEVVSRVTIYVAGTGISQKDRVTLPSPWSPTQPNLIDVQLISDEAGYHHTVLYA